jgi:hypothetical protein
MDQQATVPIASPVPAPTPSMGHSFPSSRELLMQSWAFYKKRFKSLITIAIVPFVVLFVGGVILGLSGDFATSSNGTVTALNQTGVIIAIAFVIIAAYISILGFAALLHNIISPDGSEQIGAAFSAAQDDVLPLFWTGLLTFLAVLGGAILLIVPGIIFAFWFSQSSFVVVTEKLQGPGAMKQSKVYVKGNVGQIFKKGFYLGILSIVAIIIVAIVFGILDKVTGQNIFSVFATTVLRVLLYPLTAVYTFLLFKELKASKGQITQ